MYRSAVWLCVLILALSAVAAAQTTDENAVGGMLMTDGVTGQKATPHGWSEELVYAIPLKGGVGMGVRSSENPQGRYGMPGGNKDFPGFKAGKLILFALSYDGIPAFGMRSDPKIAKNGAMSGTADLRTPAHYSVMYNKGPDEWGDDAWVSGTNFYQTFVATSSHITRVATKLADKSGDHQVLTLNYAVYEPNDGPPSTWKRISPMRSRTYGSGVDPIIHIYHVRYHSNEVDLKPGKTYAVRFWRAPGSPSEGFALVAHPDRGEGYRGGQLFQGDKPLPGLDAYAYVSGGEPGTVVNHAPVGDLDLKDFAGSATKFGQTFKASGAGLAGVDIIYATGQTTPPAFRVKFRVYDRPGGQPIGPARVCYGIPLAFQGRAAAAWMPGEVPLKPGQTYYVEWEFPAVVNTWVLSEDLPGEAYRDGKALPESDLAMSIAEYDATESTKPEAANPK